MKRGRLKQDRTATEAARWFARMNAPSISNGALMEFWEWRRRPENDAAYRRVEQMWRAGDALGEDSDIQSALRDARGRSRGGWRRWLRRGWLPGFGVALAACTIGLGFFVAALARPSIYATHTGEQRDVVLPDGSRVRLDTNSAIAVRFDAKARSIVLQRGQAFFDVIHRADRPLTVQVGDTVIRDLGTRFDVRRDGGQVRVTLVEGALEVGSNSKAQAWSMKPGQQMTAGPVTRPPAPVDLTRTTSWTTGHLVFDSLPLALATEEMNRYGAHRLILDAPNVAEIRVSGTFEATNTDAFISAVTSLYNLRADPQPDGSIRLVSRDGETRS